MLQKFFTAVLLIFFLSIFSFAQGAQNQTNSAKQKKNIKISNQIAGNGIMDLDYFLPEGENSWTLSLTSSGGFAGVTQLLAAVNSNGNYLCGPNQEFRNRLLEKDVLDRIFDFVEMYDFSKFNKSENAAINGCMDCSYRTLTLQTKNGFISRTRYSFSSNTDEVKQIYDRLSNLAECK